MTEPLFDSRYRVIRPLGSSRACEVLLAEDLFEGGQRITLKSLGAASSGDPAKLDQLRREFRLMTDLRHPNVARVLAFGVDAASGRSFITLRFIEGDTLLEIIAKHGALDPTHAVELLVQLCRALAFVHSRGVRHNDVKPANLIVEDGVLKLLDFGIADRGPVRPRQAKGTLAYLAPEAIDGQTNVRSDLFAVGVTFVEMLTGRPFHGDASPEQILDNLSFEDTFHAVRREALDLVPHLVLRRIAERLTAFAPEQRYESATHVLLDLRTELDGDIELETEETRRAYVSGTRQVGRSALQLSVATRMRDPDRAQRVSVISGRRGMGKDRFLSELLWDRQQQGARVLQASAEGASGATFGTIAQIIANALLHASDGLVAAHRHELVKLLPNHPRLRGIDPGPTLDARTERGILVHQIGSFLTSFAVEQDAPVLVAVSAAGDADTGTLDVLEEIVYQWGEDEARVGHVEVVLTIDDHAPRAAAHWIETLRAKERVDETRLPPLQVTGVTEFLESVFGVDDMEPSLRDAAHELHAHAGGTPQLLEETLRVLIEDGTIRRDTSAGSVNWMLASPLAEAQLPDDPIGLVSRQLQANAPTRDERTALEILALIGRPVRFDELRRLLDLSQEAPLHTLLQGLEAKDLITVEHDDLGPRHRLATGLLRDAVVAEIGAPGPLHQALAVRLEQILGDEADEHAEELAQHFDRGGDAPRARHYYTLAADRAVAHYANRSSLQLLERLEQLTPDDDQAARLDCLLRRATALETLGAWQDGLAVAESGQRLASELGDERGVARSELILGGLHRARGALLEAREKFLHAQEGFARVGDQHGMVQSLASRGNVSVQLGNYDEAQECHERELGIAEGLGNEEAIGVAIGQLGALHLAQERLTEAVTCFQRQLDIAERRGDERSVSISLGNLGIANRKLGNYDQAESAYLRKRDVARRIGDKHGLGIAYGNLAVLHWYRGELGRALESAHVHLALADELGDQKSIAAVSGNLGDLYTALGRPVEAEQAYDRAIGLAEKLSLRASLAAFAGGKAVMLLGQERRGEAVFHAEQALNAADDVDDAESRCLARRTLSRIRFDANPSADARARSIDEVRDWSNDAENDTVRAAYLRHLHAMTNDPRDAMAALEMYRLIESVAPKAEYRRVIEELQQALPIEMAEELGETKEIHTDDLLPVLEPGNETAPIERDPFRDLVEIGRKLAQNTTSSNLMAEILDLCLRFSQADRGLLLLCEQGDDMVVRAARTRSGHNIPEDERNYSRTVLQRVKDSREPLLVPNVVHDEGLAASGAVQDLELCSVMCLPLLAPRKLSHRAARLKGDVPGAQPLIGVLYLDSRTTADEIAWRGASLEFVQALADHAGVAIANARVYDHMDELVEQKTIALEAKMEALDSANQRLAAEIEHRKVVERRLRASVEAAQEAHTRSAGFLAHVLTELREPLRAAAGRDTEGSSDLTAILEVADVLEDIAQVESGRRAVRRKKTETLRLFADIEAGLGPGSDSVSEDLRFERLSRLPRRLDIDAERLCRALALLARRALRVGTATGSDRVRLEVGVTGLALGEPLLRVTFRDGGPLRMSTGEEGLGGAIPECEGLSALAGERLISMLGGTFSIHGEVDGGTSIQVEFELPPAGSIEWVEVDEPLPATQEISRGSTEHPLAGCRVLVIDDSKLNQRLISQFLYQAGAEVLTAEDGRTGLDAARARARATGGAPLDVVLVDLELPDLDSGAVVATLRHGGLAKAFVGLQAFSDDSPHRAAGATSHPAGVDVVVTKPVRAPLLITGCLQAIASGSAFRTA